MASPCPTSKKTISGPLPLELLPNVRIYIAREKNSMLIMFLVKKFLPIFKIVVVFFMFYRIVIYYQKEKDYKKE